MDNGAPIEVIQSLLVHGKLHKELFLTNQIWMNNSKVFADFLYLRHNTTNT